MLKYLKEQIVFKEVPDEISLALSISNCPIHCEDCNQKELWEDIGENLTVDSLSSLIDSHKGITCILLMGGEANIPCLIELFEYVKKNTNLKTAWYTGLNELPNAQSLLWKCLDYIKIGSYRADRGGLDNPKTNQRLYKTNNSKSKKEDITYLLQK